MNQQQLEQRQDEINRLDASVLIGRSGIEALRAALRDAEKAVVDTIGKAETAKRLLRVDILLEDLDAEVVKVARYANQRISEVKRIREHNNLSNARHCVRMAIEHGQLERNHGEYALACAAYEIVTYDNTEAGNAMRDLGWLVKRRLVEVIQLANAAQHAAQHA
jgi:hypothetical protein